MGREMKALECGAKVLAVIAALTAPVAVAVPPTYEANAAGTRLLSYRQIDGLDDSGSIDYKTSGDSRNPDISADGKWVVFESDASYFDLEDAGTDSDIFLHSVETGMTRRISTSFSGVDANGESFNPSISPNGKYIAFESEASNLTFLDSDGVRDIIRAQVNSIGKLVGIAKISGKDSGYTPVAGKDESTNPSVANYGKVAFESISTHIQVQPAYKKNDIEGSKDIFVGTSSPSTLRVVSVASDNTSTANGESAKPSISGVGHRVAFESTADNLLDPAEPGVADADIFIRDVNGADTDLVSRTVSGEIGEEPSFSPSLSEDGVRVAFQSMANNLAAPSGHSGEYERILVRDLAANNNHMLYETYGFASAYVPQKDPQISPDGQYVAFTVGLSVPGVPLDFKHVFIDSVAPGPALAGSKNNSGGLAQDTLDEGEDTAANQHPSLANKTDSSQRVVFESDSSDLDSYLSIGLLGPDEAVFALLGAHKCSESGTACNQVFIRDMDESAPEPGPFDPADDPLNEPLVKVKNTVAPDDDTPQNGAGESVVQTFTIKRPFDYHEIKDSHIKMPVGQGTNLNFHKCTLDEAVADNCPDGAGKGDGDIDGDGVADDINGDGTVDGDDIEPNSKVGTARSDLALLDNLMAKPLNLDLGGPGISGNVYFGEPEDGEVGRLYSVLTHDMVLPEPLVIPLKIDTDESELYRLNVVVEDLANKVEDVEALPPLTPPLDVYPNIETIEFTIDGTVTDTKGYPFMTNPTFKTTDPALPEIPNKWTDVEADIATYGGTENYRHIPYNLEDEEQLDFSPELDIKLTPSDGTADVKPNQIVDIEATLTKDPGYTDGDGVFHPGESDIRQVTVVFPEGLYLNSLASVDFCKEEHIQAWKCGKPDGSGAKIGDVSVDTPSVSKPLKGGLYAIDGPMDKPIKMAILLDDPANDSRIRYFGKAYLNQNQQIVTVFNELPPYALSEFKITLDGLVTTNGVSCSSLPKELTVDGIFKPWSKTVEDLSVTPKIVIKGGSSDCDPKAFGSSPAFMASAENMGTGANPGNLNLKIKKDAADDPIDSMKVTLPHGMGASLGATTELCTKAQITGSGCPAESEIGVIKAIGQVFDGKTIDVSGNLYMAETQGDEPARVVGRFELPEIAGGGHKIIQSPFSVENNANTIKTDVQIGMPEFNVTEVEMQLKGTGSAGQLLKNPSYPSQAHVFQGDFKSSLGATASANAAYPVHGVLPFKPGIGSRLSTAPMSWNPVITTDIDQDLGHTAMKTIGIGFSGLDLDLTKLMGSSATCPAAQWAVRVCPESSRVASLTANSWMVPGKTLTGALYLGEDAKKAYLTLRGPASIDLEGDVGIDAAKGVVSVAIEGMPPLHADIHSTIDSSIFKVPASCKPLELSFTATSYAGQNHSETEKIDYCKGASSAASLKVKLKPNRARSYTKAEFTFKQASKKQAEKLKSLEIKLGKGKRRLRASTKTLKRSTRRSRKVKTIGTLSLASSKKGRSVKAKIRVKRGRIYISPSGKKRGKSKRTLKRLKKIQRYMKKKTKIRISKGKLRLSGLPTTDVYYRVSITLNGKRHRTLRNPKRPGKVTFTAKAKTSTGSSLVASDAVEVKK